jgi:predicted SnoaL-like aldol condensation-catalyzing enzyme
MGDQGSKTGERNGQNVISYYTMAFNDKNPTRAVQLYGGDEYIQHNPLAANGFDAFIQFVTDFTNSFPDVHVDIKRVFADGDFVVRHAGKGLGHGIKSLFGKAPGWVAARIRREQATVSAPRA